MLNLPQSITKGSITTSYKYDATGRKLYKSNPTNSTYYMGALQFQQSNGSEQLYFLATQEGSVRKNGTWTAYEYFIKDHLGDVRVSFDKNTTTTGNAEIIQANAYYSFGSSLVDNSTGTDAVGYVASFKNSYLYNGKELQEENGLYDYGARFYDPIRGQFTSVDPSSEKASQESLTPYHYCRNNPIVHIDPDGKLPTVVVGALIGGAVAGGISFLEGGSLKDVAIATAGGAVSGAIIGSGIGIIGALGIGSSGGIIAVNAAVGFVAGAAESGTTQGLKVAVGDQSKVSTANVVKSAVVGTVSNVVGGAVGKLVTKGTEKAITKVASASSEPVKKFIKGAANFISEAAQNKTADKAKDQIDKEKTKRN